MFKVTLKGLLSHRVRLLLTTLSVVLGVAFVSGTYVLTDSMSRVFDDLVRGGEQTIDVFVRGTTGDVGTAAVEQFDVVPPPLAAELLDEVLAVPGVREAEGSVEGFAMIVRPDGEAIVPVGPPTLGTGWSDRSERVVREGGQPPTGPDEVVVDATTADRNGLEVGDQVSIVFATTAPRPFTLVGIASSEGGDNLAGATLAEFELTTAQEVLDLGNSYTGINVWADDGVTPDTLVERLDASLTADVEAITAAAWADEMMVSIEESLGFLTVALGSFAAIALLVGAFIIANTFSITVLQRTREFALLRALGASRRQVIATVVSEAVVVGFIASLLGIVAGVGLAAGLQQLLKAFGLDMPTGTLVVQSRTIVVALVVGLAVTTVSSLLPARRAAAVHPVAALRETGATAYHPPRARLLAGGVTAVLGLTLILVGALGRPDGAGTFVGLGAVLTLAALAALGPSLTRPVLWLMGGTGTHLGPTGHLARGNSMRTPRRTWTTAAALTIGLALVSTVAVMAASMKASVSDALDASLRADVVITAANAMTGGAVPSVLAQQLAEMPEVAAVSAVRYGPGLVDGEGPGLFAIEPTVWEQVATMEVTDGSVEAFAPVGTVAVDADLAAQGGYAVGDLVTAEFAATGTTQLRIVTIFEPDELVSGWMVSIDTIDELLPQTLDSTVLIAGAEGVSSDAVRTAVEQVASAFPAAAVQDQAEYRDSVAGQIDQILALVTALLGMALLIAVLGIMNTLALSIHERTREIGLLRAVGMTRPQVRRMVRWEAVTVALLGAVVGLVLGTGLGWALTRVLSEEGLTAFVVPGGQLVGAVVLALLAGVLAAVIPARGAAKLDVLRAVTVE